MKRTITVVLTALALSFGMWNCEDLPPATVAGGSPGALSKKVRITGTVLDVSTLIPIYNVTVFRTSGSTTDSTHTDANGAFSFEYDLGADSLQVTIGLRKHGYVDNSYTFVMVANQAVQLDLRMTPDLSTSAILSGTVRDSATLYPLRGATVIFGVPGFNDQLVTSVDGAFIFTVDLVDRDSLPVSITVSKTGYHTTAVVREVHKGQALAVGNILMQVDLGSTAGTVLGRVYDNQSRQPLASAHVTVTSSLLTDSVLTTGDGAYSFAIDMKGLSSLSASLKVEKSGYRQKNVTFGFTAGAVTYQDVYIDRDTTTGVTHDSGTGLAQSIAFISMATNQISVYGVGGTESSLIIWEVRDSLGFPIDIDHKDTVVFSLAGAPVSGGAYISPSSVITNVSGRAATIVNSGTVAGALQVVASLHRESDGVTIRSTPVLITVNAGLPDQAHFSIGPNQHNFPGYDWVNHTDGILVQVGDKYSNPVKPGTAVYFNTPGGIIDASGFTDVNGHASVTIYSGNPLPNDGVFGKGYAWVKATTLGENSVTVKDSTLLLFSGVPVLRLVTVLPPGGFDVPAHGSSGPIQFTVTDENGNPLAPGTEITVTLQYTPPPNSDYNFNVNGDVSTVLDDVLFGGPGITQFTFQVVDQTIGGTVTIPGSVDIHVKGPNGETHLTVNGQMGG